LPAEATKLQKNTSLHTWCTAELSITQAMSNRSALSKGSFDFILSILLRLILKRERKSLSTLSLGLRIPTLPRTQNIPTPQNNRTSSKYSENWQQNLFSNFGRNTDNPVVDFSYQSLFPPDKFRGNKQKTLCGRLEDTEGVPV
jgi:Neuraminidase (sialidase)